jgi:outer membrane protein TolC
MNPARHSFRQKSAWGIGIGLFLSLGLLNGCAQIRPQVSLSNKEPVVRGAQPETLPVPAGKSSPPAHHVPAPTVVEGRPLLIKLDTVFRLAHEHNGQIAIGREKLQESLAGQDLAAKRWLPDVYAGTAWYRHEGGIQDFNGNLVHSSYGSLFAGFEMRGKVDLRDAIYQKIEAERRVWQQKGELSKLTSENLLDASTTFIDLLTARTGEAIAIEMDSKLSDLQGKARKLADIDPGVKVEVSRVEAEINSQKQMIRKLREGGVSANAKLVYLLNLPPGTVLIPEEKQMVVLSLVDPNQPVQHLADQALTQGPGVRELEGLLSLIETARAKANGPGKFMPTVEVTMAEGAFGAGPGSHSVWDNRWDLGLQVRWNLTEAMTARERRRLADSRIQQVQLNYQELRSKLILGVEEAREASQSNLEQMKLGEKQIRSSEESYNLSDYRLTNNIKGASPSEVLMSLRSLIGARLNYLNSIRELDKAQLRLFVLVGAACEPKDSH